MADDDRREPAAARSVGGISRQLRKHEKEDRRRFDSIDRRLVRIENRTLILMVLVLGSNAATHYLGG